MKQIQIVCAAMAAAALGACTPAAPVPAIEAAAPRHDDILARGKYILEGVGLCSDCHTPRLADASLDVSKVLAGAPTGSTPTMPMPWANTAPAIAGLPAAYSEDQLKHFLMSGEAADGSPPLPPMPPYSMNDEDAAAVAAYIASLPKPPA
jgi:mono/diheme cytochrome c family protein